MAKIRGAVPGRVQPPPDADGGRTFRLGDPLAARFHARRARGRVPLAGRQRPGQPAGLGRRFPACSATTASTAPSRGPRSMPAIPIREAASGGQLPVYMAGHFYGSGRVFYLGSGEMWRLRAVDESYFEQFYTKLVRHVSQGRLLVGSSRGMLLVDRDRYLLGGTVVVRANCQQFAVRAARSAARSPCNRPARRHACKTCSCGRSQAARDVRRPVHRAQGRNVPAGTGRARQRGRDALAADPGQGAGPGARTPRAQRRPAERTGPVDRRQRITSAPTRCSGDTGLPELAGQLKDRTEITYLAGVKDLDFEMRWMWMLLALIAGALFLEWTMRRLSKLA